MRWIPAVVVFAMLLSAVPVTADAGPRVVVTHDVAEDGHTYVGNLNHFGFLIQGDDGAPAFHNNAVLEVELNGELLYRTTPDSGHDYDGLDTLQVSFPRPGNYTVTARVPTNGGELVDTFNGTVHAQESHPANLAIDGPSQATQGVATTWSYELRGEDGARLNHTDILVQVLDPDPRRELFRIHTHTHTEAQQLTYAFQQPGSYEILWTAYQAFPTKSSMAIQPVTETRTIEVEGAPANTVPPTPATNRPLENRVEQSASGPYELWAAFDPYTSIGTMGRIQLPTVVTSAETGDPVAHVDFEAEIAGPTGQLLFQSDTLHEYDGVLELTTTHPTPGDYTLTVTAEKGDWSETITRTYSVLPPVVPLAAGPIFATLTGLDTLAEQGSGELTVHLRDAAGKPYMHSEVQLTIRSLDTGIPLIDHKLHTHASGDFPVEASLEPGSYEVELDPTGLEPSPTPSFYGSEMGSQPIYALDVQGLDEALDPLDTSEEEASPDETPGLGLLVVVLVLTGAAMRRRW